MKTPTVKAYWILYEENQYLREENARLQELVNKFSEAAASYDPTMMIRAVFAGQEMIVAKDSYLTGQAAKAELASWFTREPD